MPFQYIPPPRLPRLSPDILAAVSDDDLESALITYVVEHMLDAGATSRPVGALPPTLEAWYIAFMVDAEVLNGGFNQLFFNPSGVLAAAAPTALLGMGMPKAADLVRQALTLLEAHAPMLEAAQATGTVEAFAETYRNQPFADLDNRYAAHEAEFRQARLAFIRRNASTFIHP